MLASDVEHMCDLAGHEVSLHVRRALRHRQVDRIPGAQPLDEVDLLERVHSRVRSGIHRRDGHVRGPELTTHRSGAELRDIGHQLRLGDAKSTESSPPRWRIASGMSLWPSISGTVFRMRKAWARKSWAGR